MIDGTPAITITLPILKPGAPDCLFSTRSAPAGMRAMRSRASFISTPRAAKRSFMICDRARIDVDRHAERLGDRVRRDVVMRRPDAAGGEHIGVAAAQRVERRDDLVLLVRHHPHLLQVDADIGEVLGDVADVLVLGAPGQDLVADDEDGGGDDGAAVMFSLSEWMSASWPPKPSLATRH